MEKELLLTEHIKELSKYLLYDLAIFTLLFFISFGFSNLILTKLLEYYSIQAYSFAPLDYIQNQMKLAITLAVIFTFPLIIFSIYYYCKEFVKINKIYLLITLSYLLGLAGFLSGITYFSKSILESMINYTTLPTYWSIGSILTLTLSTSIILALTFQLIIAIPILSKIGLINYKDYYPKRKYIMFILVIALAIITPDPTMFSTSILFVPVALSLEGGFQLSRLQKSTEIIKC